MKMTKPIFFSLLCALLAFTSCKKENLENFFNNKIALNGTEYQIVTVAFMEVEGDKNSTATFFLTTSPLNTNITATLLLNYATTDGVSGTYSIDDNQVRYMNALLSNYTVTDLTQGVNLGAVQTYGNLTSGTVIVKDKGGNEFEISFKFKPASGSEIEGNYSGKVLKQ